MKTYPYNIEKVYGPYIRKDGREIVRLRLADGSLKTKTYARYLKEIELGRELEPNEETVDHKNRNHLDNEESNLQILTRSENASKSVKRRKEVKDYCVFCGEEFVLSVHQIRNRCRGKSGPFCSRQCVGKYGRLVQHGYIEKLPPNEINVTYTRNDDEEQ